MLRLPLVLKKALAEASALEKDYVSVGFDIRVCSREKILKGGIMLKQRNIRVDVTQL